MSSKRKFRLSPDSFCYICGYYIGIKQQKHKISPGTKLVSAYSSYFVMPVGDQGKTWAPHVCCRICRSTLEGWLRGKIKCMPFAIPRIWREPTNHLTDCYFCMLDVSHYRKSKDKKSIVYPSIPSSIAPVPHCAFLLGQQGEYTKYSCFLCLWNSRADEQHYSRKLCPSEKN